MLNYVGKILILSAATSHVANFDKKLIIANIIFIQ